MSQMRVEGLAELSKALKALPAEIAGKGGGPLRRAIYQAAKLIKDQAIANAPVDTGNLKKNIVTARVRKNPHGREGYYVEVRRKRRHYARTRANVRAGRVGKTYSVTDAYYGMMVEFGTEKMSPRPFMRPAFESKKQQAAVVFRDELTKAIEAAVKKVGPR